MALFWIVQAVATCLAMVLPFGSPTGCPPPIPPIHGNFSVDDSLVDGAYPFNSSVTFTCDRGYTFSENGTADNSTLTATCQVFGNWSEEAVNCQPVYCGPPDVGFKVEINGMDHYTYQDVISFSCPRGFIFLPPGGLNATCLADGHWQWTDIPVCRAVECRSLLDDPAIPFGNISLYASGVPDPNVPTGKRDHIYQAQVLYKCDPGAVISGIPVRICLADGTWSGLPPFCQIGLKNCTAVSCAGGKTRTSCCAMNGKDIGCCTPSASLVINDRFSGVNAQCSADMADALLPCAGRIAKCLSAPRHRHQHEEDCYPMPSYGCWHNQIAPFQNLTEMMLFCSRYAGKNSATCQEDLTSTLTGIVVTRGLCLPASCVDKDSLQQVVDSSYKLYFDNDVHVLGAGYCQVSHMSINCTNGLSAMHMPSYPAPCSSDKNCPTSGLPSWTECCSLDDTPLGCCRPFVQNLITDRFKPLTGQCRNDMKGLFLPCVGSLLECLNNDISLVNYNCPNLHACSASLHTPDTCDEFTGVGSAYCTKTCQGLITCEPDHFCVPETCANEENLQQIAMGDALIACEFWKNGKMGNNCQWVNVTISCSNDINVTYTYDGSSDVKFCPAPFKPEFGGYHVRSNVPFKFPVGSEVMYFCNSGYQPTGQKGVGYFSMNISCSPSQKWNIPGPDCAAISCGKPMITNGSGIIVVGTNYSYGSTLELKCNKVGYNPHPPKITCEANGRWSEKFNPWCFAAICPDIPRLLTIPSSSVAPVPILYGEARVLKFGVNDTHYSPGDWNHLYGAVMKFTCQAGTTGSQNASCTASGSWSSDNFICKVPEDRCTVSGPNRCPDKQSEATECCAFGDSSEGPACCKPMTRQLINNRFVGVEGQCLADMLTSFQNCSTQIISCVDKGNDTDCLSQVYAYYSYGCNNGLPPPGQGYVRNCTDPFLTQFCSSFEPASVETVPCFEQERDALSGRIVQGRGVCVPSSCAATETGLKTLANSTLALTCAAQTQMGQYCSASGVKLTCSNGVSAEATFDTSCGHGCPKAGHDMSLTACCETGNVTLGCCKKQTAQVITDRFVNITGECQSAFRKQFLTCGPTMSRCLDSIVETSRPYNCPGSHGCEVDARQQNCATLMNNTGAAMCQVTCSGIDTCHGDYYCLPAECFNEVNVRQINAGDAVLGCDFWKLTQGSSATCNAVTTETTCAVPGKEPIKATFTYHSPGPVPKKKKTGLSAGATVGIVFAALISAVLASLVVYTFYKRRHTAGVGYQKLSETVN